MIWSLPYEPRRPSVIRCVPGGAGYGAGVAAEGVIMECLQGAAIIAVFWLVVIAAYQLAVRMQPRG